MRGLLTLLLLCLLATGAQAQQSGGGGTGGGGGTTPAGATDSVQYKVNATTLGGGEYLFDIGGSNGLYTAGTGMILQQRPASYLSINGGFDFYANSAAIGPGERRDDTMSIGWNMTGEVPPGGGFGSQSGLIFEAHCGPTVGCPGAGQSETYFLVDDGYGRSSRPFGIFQSHDNSLPGISIITRSDSWRMWDPTQTYEAMDVAFETVGPLTSGVVSLVAHSRMSFAGDHSSAAYPFLSVNGGNVLSQSIAGDILICPDSGCFIGGGSGTPVVVGGSGLQITTGLMSDSSGHPTVQWANGSTAHYFSFGGGGGAGSGLLLKPLGSDSAVDVEIQTKGNGNLMLTTIGASGGVIWNLQSSAFMQIYDLGGSLRTGVNATGTTCVITRITHGLVTAASCS